MHTTNHPTRSPHSFSFIPRVASSTILILLMASMPTAGTLFLDQEVSIDSLRATIEAMQNLRTRFSGTKGADSAAVYIRTKLISMGYSAEIDTVHYLSGFPKRTFNIVTTKRGYLRQDEKIVLGAHYDSISKFSYSDSLSPAPGADDNASGCAALLEIARVIRNTTLSKNIDMVFFGGEEVGRKGSIQYASRAREENEKITAMLSFDAIGYEEDPVWDVSIYYNASSETLAQTCEIGLKETGEDLVPIRINNPFWAQSDHYSFWEQDYNAVHIFEGADDSNPNFHSSEDIITGINFDYLAAITRSIITITLVIGTSQESKKIITLGRAYPNPSPSSVCVEYTLYVRTFLTINIYDVVGRTVEELFRGPKCPGYDVVEWSGEIRGRRVPSGIYFINFSTPSGRETKKITILR